MEDLELERRKQRRLDQIGTNNPRCKCGETDWRCFEATTMPDCVNCSIKSAVDANMERAKQRRLKKLKTSEPRCAMCGENDWRCIEEHHFAGRRRDSKTVLLCANDHLRMTDDQNDHPKSDPSGDPLLERIAHGMLGLADMLRVIVEWLVELGHALLERAQTHCSQPDGAYCDKL